MTSIVDFQKHDGGEPDEVEQHHGEREAEQYLRVGEVAALFHVSPKTIARWADEGRLPHIVTLGGHRRFPARAIEELIQQSRPGNEG